MQKMRIVTMQLGMLATNCYLVINEETGELVIIDPAGEADRILVRVRQMKARPVAVLLTHGHFDHIGAVASLQKTYSIPVCAMAEEQELLQDAQKNLSGLYGKPVTVQADRFFRDKETVQLAGFLFQVLYTPGHTVGGCCYYCAEEQVLFSGDTLFHGSVGRTDFPTGSMIPFTGSSLCCRQRRLSIRDMARRRILHTKSGTIRTRREQDDHSRIRQTDVSI